jgi:hypothetical protein
MKFRDIITLEDDYEVAKAKATIAVKAFTWCLEVEEFTEEVTCSKN